MSHWATLRTRTVTALAAAGVAGGNVKASRFMPTKDADLPIALVYVRRESLAADGGARSGFPTFVNTLDLRVKIRIRATSDEALEPALDGHVQSVLDATLKSSVWFGDDIEGIDAVDITYDEAETGSYLGEAEIALGILYRSAFEPEVTDDLDIVAASEPGTGSGVLIDGLSED